MAIISGRRCPLYDRLYPDWTRVERSARRNGRGSAIESLWLSPAAAARAPLLSLPETLGLAAPAGAAPPRDA